jgi:tight adherence protein B
MTPAAAATPIAVLAVLVVAGALRPPPTRVVELVSPPLPARPGGPLHRRARRRRTPHPDASAVASWCDDLARELRSGSTLRQTLASVEPDDAPTSCCTAPLRLGLQRARPLGELLTGDVGPHLHLAFAVIIAAADVGGSAAPAIDRVATTLRQRAADRDDRRVQAAQARLSAHVMTAVPIVMLALLVASDGDVRAILATPIGAACVALGLSLNATGWLWMRRIVGAGA